MIAIVNVSRRLRKSGWHTYELRINDKVIAKFRHKREEDLETCLLKAAEAAKWDELERIRKICEERADVLHRSRLRESE